MSVHAMLVFHVHNKCGHERLMLSLVKILCNGDGGGGGGEAEKWDMFGFKIKTYIKSLQK